MQYAAGPRRDLTTYVLTYLKQVETYARGLAVNPIDMSLRAAYVRQANAGEHFEHFGIYDLIRGGSGHSSGSFVVQHL